MEDVINDKFNGMEIFANFVSASVKYGILTIYVVCASCAHIANRVRRLANAGRK